jgi:hypothetical protein
MTAKSRKPILPNVVLAVVLVPTPVPKARNRISNADTNTKIAG